MDIIRIKKEIVEVMAIVTGIKNALMGLYVVSTQVRKESLNLNIWTSQAEMKKIKQ